MPRVDRSTEQTAAPESAAVPALRDGRPKPAGTWSRFGSLDPEPHDTFSVGVFQRVEKYGGKTARTGKTMKRISGPIRIPSEVCKAARLFVSKQP